MQRMGDRVSQLEQKWNAFAAGSLPRTFGEEDRSMIDVAWLLQHIDRPQTIMFQAVRDIFASRAHPGNWNLAAILDPAIGGISGDMLTLSPANPSYCGFTFDGKTWVEHTPQQFYQILSDLLRSLSRLIDSLAKRALDVSLVDKYKALQNYLQCGPDKLVYPQQLYESLKILFRQTQIRTFLQGSFEHGLRVEAPSLFAGGSLPGFPTPSLF
eukprot:GILK01014878.1.p1 GENE.GILK01014878.1~~GILK01014878.1.p1  ORF type:complete len:212 (-),score=25.09 GILK01014878.1:173-808(-)